MPGARPRGVGAQSRTVDGHPWTGERLACVLSVAACFYLIADDVCGSENWPCLGYHSLRAEGSCAADVLVIYGYFTCN